MKVNIPNPHDDGDTTLIVICDISEEEPAFVYAASGDEESEIEIDIRRIGLVTDDGITDVTDEYEGVDLEPIVDAVREKYIQRSGRYVGR